MVLCELDIRTFFFNSIKGTKLTRNHNKVLFVVKRLLTPLSLLPSRTFKLLFSWKLAYFGTLTRRDSEGSMEMRVTNT